MTSAQKRAISWEVDDIPIIGELYIPEKKGRQSYPALCICHGIPAGRTPDPADGGYPLLAQTFCHAGFVTMVFNFRGTGLSGGNIDLWGWTKDLKAVLDSLYAVEEVDRAHFCLMGFSGGAAVSTYVASQDQRVTSVVLCACPVHFQFLEKADSLIEHFRRIGLIRDKNFPLSTAEWRERFERVTPLLWIDKISPRPLLIIHGEQDTVVEVSHARTLYEKAREPKQIVIVEGGEHRLRLNEKAMKIALEWLKERIARLTQR